MSLDEVSGEEETSPSSKVVPRTSVRVLNKQLLQTKQPEAQVPEILEDLSSSSSLLESSKKRTWEQWWSEDERSFFEALCDSGKNFESMREYFVKQKKTNKTKGQIRTFYYRTWHKISRYISFPEGLSKSTKELYGLINYGELRKKRLGGKLDEKMAGKLTELVFNGSTTLRIKGKSVRLKTPTCPALKRLNLHRRISALVTSSHHSPQDVSGEPSDPYRLPRTIQISLSPLSQRDFIRVHGKALMNPKLSLGTDLQRTVGSLVKYLEEKWSNRVGGGGGTQQDERLILRPKPGVSLRKPVFLPLEPLRSEDLSLGRVTQEENEMEDLPISSEESKEEEEANKAEEEEQPWDANCGLSVGEMYLMLCPGSSEVELKYTFYANKPPSSKDSYKSLHTLLKLVQEKLKKSKSSELSPVKNVTHHEDNEQEEEDVFRRPLIPTPAATAFKQQLDLLLPKYNLRKGRPMSRKNLSVRPQRPLQPKFVLPTSSSSKSEVKLRLLPQITVTHPFISLQKPPPPEIPWEGQKQPSSPHHHTPTSPPHSIYSSSLKSTDRFLDSVLEGSSLLQTPPRVRPSSPFSEDACGSSNVSWTFPSSLDDDARLLHDEDNSSHSTSASSEVDRQILSMMTESSVDFTSKFAKLTSHITSDV